MLGKFGPGGITKFVLEPVYVKRIIDWRIFRYLYDSTGNLDLVFLQEEDELATRAWKGTLVRAVRRRAPGIPQRIDAVYLPFNGIVNRPVEQISRYRE